MVVVNLKGGLGNQMFQFAFGLYLAKLNKTEVALDLTFLLNRTPRENFVFRDFDLDIFDSSYKILNSEEVSIFKSRKGILNKILKRIPFFLTEKSFAYDNSNIVSYKSIYLDGYWQTEKYFKSIESDLKSVFKFKELTSQNELELAYQIKNTESVCINFRRGDFVHLKGSNETHGVTSMDYYNEALFELSKQKQNLSLYIFSDDIDWCKENLKWDFPTFFVDHSYKGEKFSSYLHLMTLCKNFIIPNSTFAWWAAWLSKSNNKIVYAPKKWFENKELQSQANDIYPENWIKI